MDFLTHIAVEYRDVFIAIHLFAMVLGLGGATYSDILLVRFLKDFKISKKEAEVIGTMSKIIFAGIFLAFISGLMLFLVKPTVLLETPKFLAKCVAFAIVTINGYALHQVVLPKLIHFDFKKNHFLHYGRIHLRHAGFIMGAISFTSWYMIFLMGAFSNIPLSLTTLLGLYFGVMICAIIGALILERLITHVSK